jgi:hypothetical protein
MLRYPANYYQLSEGERMTKENEQINRYDLIAAKRKENIEIYFKWLLFIFMLTCVMFNGGFLALGVFYHINKLIIVSGVLWVVIANLMYYGVYNNWYSVAKK